MNKVEWMSVSLEKCEFAHNNLITTQMGEQSCILTQLSLKRKEALTFLSYAGQV